jgi:F-type H+-transporting ATPase subunit b
MADETGIFDLPNTSLIFWEIITFLILLFLLWRYVYPPIRDQILRRQSEIEGAEDPQRGAGASGRVPAPDR